MGPHVSFFSPDLGLKPLIPACIGTFPFEQFADLDDCSAIMNLSEGTSSLPLRLRP